LAWKSNLTAPDDPALVTGDVDELIQVFSNLIENACKYGQSGKRVEITISEAEAELRPCHRAGILDPA
jgi:two-component system phosphate regulon sensor histidine kinase PhoR